MEKTAILNRIVAGETLSRQEASEVMMAVTRSEFTAEQIAALLTGIQMRGVVADELLGLRDAVLQTGVPVDAGCERFIDIVGTGGDQKNTFNISTCACLVVAGAGYKVVKHGNYAATSTSGASNVIEAHGAKFTADADKIKRSLDEAGFVYLHAPLFAKAMKYVAPIRKALPFPTCFNLLGPLVNPSRPTCQLLGVATPAQMKLYENLCLKMGIDFGILNSNDGYDEISLTSGFKVATRIGENAYTPEEIGMRRVAPESLVGGATVEEAKKIFDEVLENRSTDDRKSVVLANAAFAITVVDPDKSLSNALVIARESLESGKALGALKQYLSVMA